MQIFKNKLDKSHDRRMLNKWFSSHARRALTYYGCAFSSFGLIYFLLSPIVDSVGTDRVVLWILFAGIWMLILSGRFDKEHDGVNNVKSTTLFDHWIEYDSADDLKNGTNGKVCDYSGTIVQTDELFVLSCNYGYGLITEVFLWCDSDKYESAVNRIVWSKHPFQFGHSFRLNDKYIKPVMFGNGKVREDFVSYW